MITLDSPPAAEAALIAARHINRTLIASMDNILALTDIGTSSSELALASVSGIRSQAQLSADWAAIHGVTDTDSQDLGTGSTREIVFVLTQIVTETKIADDDAGLARKALQGIRARANRVLSARRAA